MMREPEANDDVVAALRRMAREIQVPPAPSNREAALMRAFDTRIAKPRIVERTVRRQSGRWWLTALAGATAVLIAFAAGPGFSGSRSSSVAGQRSRGQESSASKSVNASFPVGDFIPWPGAATLPPLESGELVRLDLPVSILPSLGVVPPAGHVTAVKADVVFGQDGLARAVRFVGN
jgi:hypothetical protein